MRVLLLQGLQVDAAAAALLELAVIVTRSFVIFLYCVVVTAVSHLRKKLLLVAAEARDSK